MQPLDKGLRNKLKRTVIEAREIADDAALSAFEHLGVREPGPYSHLTDGERDLRRKLRIHGRQLGDNLDSKTQKQEIDLLIEEVAYEHWHRMLFARFLAENNLLMYPDPDAPVAITLDELPKELFTASDSLGSVYQFWQSKKKDEINASEVKIGARELPAVTQLFTEPYMVSFLLDNSLGAWWVARRLTEEDLKNAESEEELREKASLPGVPLEYLRFIKDEDGKWTPAAGIFDGWPEHLSGLKTLDPCCGSGHFLVAALLMLVPMRMELEGLSAREAVDAVLSDNLHGLEIDKRCVELAAFNIAINAWRYPNAGGYRPLPELNVACSGLAPNVGREEWVKLAGDNHNLFIALGWLYNGFKDAPF